MGVARRHATAFMTHDFFSDLGGDSLDQKPGGEGVAQIMDSQIGDPRPPAGQPPCRLDVAAAVALGVRTTRRGEEDKPAPRFRAGQDLPAWQQFAGAAARRGPRLRCGRPACCVWCCEKPPSRTELDILPAQRQRLADPRTQRSKRISRHKCGEEASSSRLASSSLAHRVRPRLIVPAGRSKAGTSHHLRGAFAAQFNTAVGGMIRERCTVAGERPRNRCRITFSTAA